MGNSAPHMLQLEPGLIVDEGAAPRAATEEGCRFAGRVILDEL